MAARRVSDAELFAELEAVVDGRLDADDFFTSEQLAQEMGREVQAARRRIKAALRLGLCDVRRVPGVDVRGIACVNTVYRLRTEAKA